MRVTFYGVRGGYPASGPGFNRIGSHTTCIRIDAGGHLIVIDAGTGMANVGRDLLRNRKRRRAGLDVTLLLTHGHHDHLAGLPHFLPAYFAETSVWAFGPPAMGTERAIVRMFQPPWFPVRFSELLATWAFHDLRESEVILLPPKKPPKVIARAAAGKAGTDDVVIRVVRCYGHMRDGVYVYRIEHRGRSVVIATDVETPQGGDERLRRISAGADLLVHDAQYTEMQYVGIPTQGYGHSTPRMAGEAAVAAKVKRLLLTHHAPEHDDETVERLTDEARACFPNTEPAHEGMVVELRPKKRNQ